jgi:hypothetical protein
MESRAIIEALCDAQEQCFNGFGCHLATDFLYLQGIFPGAPERFVCEDDVRYQHFNHGIKEYMAIGKSHDFIARVCGECNSDNPFAYNYAAAQNYYSSYVKVFRKKWVQVPKQLYNYYVCNGLLDLEHTIGHF